jgi:hypothetical protein
VFVVEVVTIGGGILGFLGVFCSYSVLSASAVSVSMSVVLRDAKKLRVNTAFGGILSCGCWERFSRLLGCLRGVVIDMPLASLYFL